MNSISSTTSSEATERTDLELPSEIDFTGGVRGKYTPRQTEARLRKSLMAQLERLRKERDEAEQAADDLRQRNERLRETLEAVLVMLGDPLGYCEEDRHEVAEAVSEIRRALVHTSTTGSDRH